MLVACGRSVTVTVVVDRAILLAEPKAGAAKVGEQVPGTRIEARRPGWFGARDYYEIQRGETTAYLSVEQAAPVPLDAAAMVVVDDRTDVFADRARSSAVEELRFGDELQVYEKGSDAAVLAQVKGGLLAGFLARGAAVPAADAPERLGAAVLAAARSGDVPLALQRASRMQGPLAPSGRLAALIERLPHAAELSGKVGFKDEAGAPLRTGAPPVAGARAYVVPLTVPVYATDKMEGPPREVLEVDEPVDVKEVGLRTAKVLASEEVGWVYANALQLEPQTAPELRALAEGFAGQGKTGEQLELLARASLLPGARPDAFEELFDLAYAAGAMDWAAWATQRGRFVELVVWGTGTDSAGADGEAEALSRLAEALDPVLAVQASVLENFDVEGLPAGTQVIAAGACRDGERVDPQVLALLAQLRPNVAVGVQRVRLLAREEGRPRLACPGFVSAQQNDCGRWAHWSVAGDATIFSGKRVLHGLQFVYQSASCGDWYEAERGVVNAFLLTEADGTLVTAHATDPEITKSDLGVQFPLLDSSIEASGKGIVATFDRADADCAGARSWEIMRDSLKATVQGDEIVLSGVRTKRVRTGECVAPRARKAGADAGEDDEDHEDEGGQAEADGGGDDGGGDEAQGE
jgi:hypothetical protein